MKRDSINYLAVGSIVLMALLLLLYALFRLTGGVGENAAYTLNYPNIAGLSEGTPVTYEGYKIGSVGAIEPVREQAQTRYRLTLLLRDGWPIPIDSVAHITSEGLLAETVINIHEGKSNRLLEPGGTLTAGTALDMFSAVNNVANNVNALLETELTKLLDNLDQRVTAIGDQVGAGLPKILSNVDRLLTTLQATIDRLAVFLDAETEQRFDQIMVNGLTLSDRLLDFADELDDTRAAADVLVRESHAAVGENRDDLRRATLALRDALERLATDSDVILQNLDVATRNMKEFSRQLRQNPGMLLNSRPARETGVNNAR